MSEPLYKTSNLQKIKRIVGVGRQPLCVELIDGTFLLFTFPAAVAILIARTVSAGCPTWAGRIG